MPSTASQLRRLGVAEVSDDAAVLGAYSSDASLYRVPPAAVAFPRTPDDVRRALLAARELGLPLTTRGAGTSVAGNAIGSGLVLDLSRHLDRVISVDPGTATAVVQPGVVQADLQRAAAPYGLRFGPDPSTSSRCTIGGMIGNDACGARSLAHGRTSHNVLGLRALLADGSELLTGYDAEGRPTATLSPAAPAGTDGSGGADVLERLRALVATDLATLRTSFDTFGRHVSGLALHHLLPENGFDLTRALVGSEGTLAVVTEATLRLVRDPAERLLVVLGFDDFPAAGYAAPAVLEHAPSACEGLDRRIVDVIVERKGAHAVPPLPAGQAWLFTEISGEDAAEVRDRAERLAAAGLGVSALVVDDPAAAAALWRIRADGAGLAGRAPSGRPAWAGWEDSAVPPARLGDYLAALEELLAVHGLTAMPFGHFGEGCLHVRFDFAFDAPDGPERYRAFIGAAADLVASFGGSLSGEHGDGRARSEWLPRMYPTAALRLMAEVKRILDPDDLLNPGLLADPAGVASSTADLRYTADTRTPPPRHGLALAYTGDGGDFSRAVHRCTGVGACRAPVATTPSGGAVSAGGGVMCPSFQATHDEIHSTRGRARLLQEIVNADSDLEWSSPAVHEALDLCLACKGCASDCPTGTDLASYKAEVLHQTYRRRLRPRSHYALGWLPRWARLASRVPGAANRVLGWAPTRTLALRAAGVDTRRRMPAFAPRPFRRTFTGAAGAVGAAGGAGTTPRTPVLLFVDSFSERFAPQVAEATVAVLRDAGYEPHLTARPECCGLSWISTGQLDGARRRLRSLVEAMAPDARAGVPIVGLEPSCTAVLRHELVELVPGEDARAVAAAAVTLAELLTGTEGWTPPDLSGLDVVAQPHCHHHAVLGWSTDAALLRGAGARVRALSGCCGMAGNFGVEQGHYEVSVAIAGQHLLPALAQPPAPGAQRVVLADGFSCRTQLDELAPDARPVHLAQLLARDLTT
ncbi:FAD-binding and (Fe-S)-binding domain-containing protein [Nocardioides faecalis]|uniref:FAD-binding and (Fe-S)-binding domain-containing protein n=1 Tax=Nocardioides faecalis TaxID=2803858 RepID=UPI0027DD4F21|nr:FAD-binding and (Fe-S)-binding domain-containing protein [Nocardioides faecalis]